jgi:hypothetical protein
MQPSSPMREIDYYTEARRQSYHFGQLLHLQSYDEFIDSDKTLLRMYGRFLGADLSKHPHLFKIVVSAIADQCPCTWVEMFDIHGIVYYQNNLLHSISRHHPLDDYYRTLIKNQTKKTPWCILW